MEGIFFAVAILANIAMVVFVVRFKRLEAEMEAMKTHSDFKRGYSDANTEAASEGVHVVAETVKAYRKNRLFSRYIYGYACAHADLTESEHPKPWKNVGADDDEWRFGW